jgi:membrane protein
MFRLIPNRYVPRSHALIGAVVAAVLFETMNRVFGYYISHFPTYKLVYGAFASVPIFLMWVYLSWLTILLGAVIAASLSHWRTTARRDLPVTLRLFEAIRVLRIMSLNLQNGKVTTFPVLSKKLGIGYDVLEELLEVLQRAGVVCKAEGQGWLMIRAPGHIRMNELLRLFVVNRNSLAVYDQTDPVQQWLVARIERMEQDTEMTLQELFALQA